MSEVWTLDLFVQVKEAWKMAFCQIYLQWLGQIERQVPEDQRRPIDQEFMSIWRYLLELRFDENVAKNMEDFPMKIKSIEQWVTQVRVIPQP